MTEKPSTKNKTNREGRKLSPISRVEAKAYQKVRRLVDRALEGDTDALIKILKISGDLPEDYRPRY